MRSVRTVCFLVCYRYFYRCTTNVHCFSLSAPFTSVSVEYPVAIPLSPQLHHQRSTGRALWSSSDCQRRKHCSSGFSPNSAYRRPLIPCLHSRFSSLDDDDDDDDDDFSNGGTNASKQQISPDSLITSSTRQRRQQQNPRRQRWVLLVDDESAIRQAVGQLLMESDFRVTTCQNGREAWQIIGGPDEIETIIHENATVWSTPTLSASNEVTNTTTAATATATGTKIASTAESTQFESVFDVNPPFQYTTTSIPVVANDGSVGRMLPDVIVSDVHMPIMDGLTLLSTIRSTERVAHIPVVLLTVRAGPTDRVEGYRAGADAYLPKPFDPDELVTLLHNVMNRHEQMYTPLVLELDRSTTGTSDINNSGSSSSSSSALLGALKRDVLEIQDWIVQRGGGGSGQPGWVAATDVFLAPDERQILTLLCDGLLNKDIAERTFLSTRRVEQLLTSMYRKIKVKNRTELVRWAIATGTVKLQ